MQRGEIYYAQLNPVVGSEQGGNRPVLIIQNDKGNYYSPTTIIATITSRQTKARLPTHIWLNSECGLPQESMIECEQLRTVDKSRLSAYIGEAGAHVMRQVDEALKISLSIKD